MLWVRERRLLMLAPGSRVVIRRYATRSRGVVEICDLEQEAALTALEVERRPDVRDRDSYETRAVAVALCKLVAEMRAPVSLPGHMDEAWREAAGARRASLYGPGQDGDQQAEERRELARVATEAFEPAEDAIDRERALEHIRSAMARESEAARAVLLEGEKSATVAQRLGMSVRQVYDRTAEAMERLRAAFAPTGRVA